MAENKVCFGLKNVHYAMVTVSSGTVTFGTPKAIAGAVNLTLSAEGETNKFYADNIAYYTAIANQGYSGDIEFARIPDEVFEDLWGFTLDSTDKTLIENASAEAKPFALGFQIDGDQGNELHWLYNCVATRPNVAGATIAESKEPQTQSCGITVTPLADGRIRIKSTATTTSTIISGWFTAVVE